MHPTVTSTTLLSSILLLTSIILPGTSFVITNSPTHLHQENDHIDGVHAIVHKDTNDRILSTRSRKHNQSLLEKLVQYLRPHDSLAQDNALLAIAIHDTEIAAIKNGGKPGKVIKRFEGKSPGSDKGIMDMISAFVMAKGSNGWVTFRRKENVRRQDPDDPVGEGDDDYPETGLTDQPDIVDGGNEGGAAATSTVDPGAATSDMPSAGDADGGDASSDGGDDGGNAEPDGSAAIAVAPPLPSPPTTMLPLAALTTEATAMAPAAATTTVASLPDYPGGPCIPASR